MMIKRFIYSSLAILATILLLPSCAKNEGSLEGALSAVENDSQTILQYLRKNGLDSGIIINQTGLICKIVKQGNGRDYINLEQTPTVVYQRKLLKENKIVESSSNAPTKFDGRKLKDHILGWQIGLQLISKGGHIIMYIPANLAFGKEGVPGIIPPNAILICDVKLIDFE